MSLPFGEAEATALLELIASGANKAKIYRHFSMQGADQMISMVDHFPLADIEGLKQELDQLCESEQTSNVLAQQAFIYGALIVMLSYLTTTDADSPVTQELQEFLANHPILTASEIVVGLDEMIEEARASGAPEALVSEMVSGRDKAAAEAAAESG